MSLRVLMVGADLTVGGIQLYVEKITSLSDPACFEYHMTVSDSSVSELSDRFTGVIKHVLPTNYTPWSLLLCTQRLRSLIIRWKIDVLHIHAARAGLVGCLSAHGLPIGIVYTGHGWRFNQLSGKRRRFIIRSIEKYICERSTLVIFVRESDRKYGIEMGLIDEDKAIVVNTRIEASRHKSANPRAILMKKRELGIPNQSPIIGIVGRLVEEKDPLTFVHVAAKVRESMPETYFLWIGDGKLRANFEKLARELALDDHIIITGLKSPEEIPLLIQTMNVYLNTSCVDVMPLSILEAQASRKPVVSSAYKGVEDIIKHKVTGLCFMPGNSAEAAQYIVMLLENPQIANSIAAEAYKRFLNEHADPRIMVQHYEDIYRGVAC